MAIRYNVGGLNTEMQRTVKNFNAKVRRLQRKGQRLTPSTISMQELKEGYATRAELKRALRRYQSFSEKGAEDIITTEGGVEMSQYEFKNIKADIKRLKMNATKTINMLKKPTRYPMMQSEQITKLQRVQSNLNANFRKMGKTDFKEFSKKITNYLSKLTRNEEFYSSFFKMLFSDAFVAGVDPEILKSIEKKLRKLSPNRLYDLYRVTPELQAIVESYDLFVSQINIKKDFRATKTNLTNFTGKKDNFEEDLMNIVSGNSKSHYDEASNSIQAKFVNLNDNLDQIIDDYKAG